MRRLALEAALNPTVPLSIQIARGRTPLDTAIAIMLFSFTMASSVGSVRGATDNLPATVGTAVAGALLVGLLTASIVRHVVDNPVIPPEFNAQVDLDNVDFVINKRLLEVMQRTTPEQVVEAMRINVDARSRALKIGMLIMVGCCVVGALPCRQSA
ncbi:MAG: hypothetical protein J2P54_26940 [Bradyrhizobiaceae bacterium]|nr:hypothetical protein [Bradyrhizobiaceae bacterium]